MNGKKMFSKKWSIVLVLRLAGGVALQFVRPPLESLPDSGDFAGPADVKQILERACYDCHSNRTNLAWFDQIVPAYWLVRDDILKARKAMNFSSWDSLPADQRKGKLFEAFNKIQYKEMPLASYRFLHSGGSITGREMEILQSYLDTLAPVVVQNPKRERAGNEQFVRWSVDNLHRAGLGLGGETPRLSDSGQYRPVPVKSTLNGIAFDPDYRDWGVISTTDRWDNGTLRVILGNAIAVRAVKENHLHPWPDGTEFAKVAWDAVQDSNGQVHTGEFKQVEFMLKNAQKYAGTEGWGWARWKGMTLQPYGKTVNFVTECTSCHKPMKEFDYAFTLPKNLAADVGQVEDASRLNPLDWKVITSFVNKKDGTMSTLYGNDLALKLARLGPAYNYSAGAAITLVTWKQIADEHWFGGRQPGPVTSLERVSWTDSGAEVYDRYEGSPLKKIEQTNSSDTKMRIAYIVGQKASVLP